MIFNQHDKVVFFGDSLTQWTSRLFSQIPAVRYKTGYAQSYVDILLKRILVHFPEIELEVYNKGVGGNTTLHLLERVGPDVLQLHPDWVVLFTGQNDAGRFSLKEFEANLMRLLDIFKQQDIKVLQLSTTPPGRSASEAGKILDEFDSIIKRSSKQYGNIFVDIKRKFRHVESYNLSGVHIVELFGEGCHMSELGNILIADEIFNVITKK